METEKSNIKSYFSIEENIHRSSFSLDYYDFYLAASLRDGKYDMRNKAIEAIFNENNKRIFRPYISKELNAQQILIRNMQAIKNSSCFLFLDDDPGEGVFIELGYAFALNRQIYIYSQQEKFYGQMFKGIVESLPKENIFNSIDEFIKLILKK